MSIHPSQVPMLPRQEVIEIALIAIAQFNFILFAIFLLSKPDGNPTGNRLFATFLLLKAFCYLDATLGVLVGAPLPPFFAWLVRLSYSGDLLLGPVLMLYIQANIQSDFHLTRSMLWHGLPCVIYLGALGVLSLANAGGFAQVAHGIQTALRKGFFHVQVLQFIAYALYALGNLIWYRKASVQWRSSLEPVTYGWLVTTLVSFSLLWALAYLNFWLHALGSGQLLPPLAITMGIFGFSSGIVFMAWRHPELFHGLPGKQLREKYAKNPLPDHLKHHYLERLKTHMGTHKPHLDPEVSLDRLSEALRIQPHFLSQVLNGALDTNFYKFINKHRLEEAMARLADPAYDGQSILEICFGCGFNSKSSFYSLFKAQTGCTPVQFRAERQQAAKTA